MAFQSVKLSEIDAFPDLEIPFSFQDVETVIIPAGKTADSNIGHGLSRPFAARNRYDAPRLSGRPSATRCLSKDEVYHLEALYWTAEKEGFPLNAFVTLNLGTEDKIKLRKRLEYILREAGKFGPAYAAWTYEKPLRGELHVHLLIHASDAVMAMLHKMGQRKRFLDPQTKKKQRMKTVPVTDNDIIAYLTKQHEAVEGEKRLLQPEKKRQYCERISGERWGASPALKALIPVKKKPRACRQGPLRKLNPSPMNITVRIKRAA